MLNILLNIVPFIIASYDSGFYNIDRKAIADYLEAWSITKLTNLEK